MENNSQNLPKELKSLVNQLVSLLGEVILEEAGKQAFILVEKIRKDMVLYRKSSKKKRALLLEETFKLLKNKSPEKRSEVAQAYTLMLELVNACETAYRSFRLKQSPRAEIPERRSNALVFVLTAHPTEVRTEQNIDIFHRIQEIALRILEKQSEAKYLKYLIKHNLKLAWLMPITRHSKPQVLDEAKHLYSIIFRPNIFNTILKSNRDQGVIRIRTWVGGDKDGHPGVDEKVMLSCLQASRIEFQKLILSLFVLLEKDLGYLQLDLLVKKVKEIKQELKSIKTISSGDSGRIEEFKKDLQKLSDNYKSIVGEENPRIRKVFSIFKMFPALVIPLELREDSEIIAKALKSGDELAISRMLISLGEISTGGNVSSYAQGFIISMCESSEDIKNAMKLVKAKLNHKNPFSIPIVPLFETASALAASVVIVNEILENKKFHSYVTKKWSNNFEIMLGYSDSSKGMGVLASRLGIAKAMRSLDKVLVAKGIQPQFFHGSGGSVDRGGGNLKEQTAWWPRSALCFYKATVQGEMVERNFSSPEILSSNIHTILSRFEKSKPKKGDVKINTEILKFSEIVSDEYKKKIGEEDFFHMVEKATPYSYLKVLKLGSRPTKRAKSNKLDFSSIRAIPWVLCWTQTRSLFPTWWGVGKAWNEYKKDSIKKQSLIKAYSSSGIFASFLRVLGFSLSKVDLEIFKMYLSKSSLSELEKKKAYDDFLAEYKMACDFVRTITGEKNLLWHRPWMEESIVLRSSMIHPLNILQILAHDEDDLNLIRKTTAGISSGMLTTG